MSNNLKNQQRILQTLSDDPQDEMQAYGDLIYDYAEAQVEGKDAATLFPEVHAYLADFGDEDEHYQAVFSLLEAEKYGRLEVLPTEFRLKAENILPDEIDVPEEPFVVFKQPNGNFMGRIRQGFLDMLSNQPIQNQPAFLLGEESELFKLEVEVAESNSPKFTVEATRVDQSNDPSDPHCALTVQFIKEGVPWPKRGGTTVKLTDTETQKALGEQMTDPFGKVKFDQVSLAKLGKIAIEIEN